MQCNKQLRNAMGTLFKLICLIVLTMACAPESNAQVKKFGGCSIDFEIMRLPDCVIEVKDGRSYVLKEFAEYVLSRRQVGVAAWPVTVEGRHLAWTNLPDVGWAYFDRTGLVLVQNVATMDNGADTFYHGLVRVTKNDKWGLANIEGRLVVPMQYDGILDYTPHIGWLACAGCRTQTDANREHFWFLGGAWYRLSGLGRVIGRTTDPSARSLPN